MSEVIEHTREAAPPVTQSGTTMLERAVERGASIEMIEKLMELEERQYRTNAERQFNISMSKAYGNFPAILKTAKADRFKYDQLGDIIEAVSGPLSDQGLSVDFDIDQDMDKNRVRVTCNIRSTEGHCKSVSAEAEIKGPPNTTPVMALQATVTGLQRLTLKAALGLGAKEDPSMMTTGETFDETPWTTKIEAADTMADLFKIGEDLKTVRGIPDRNLRNLKAKWAARRKQVQSEEDQNG